jgi:membrane associated rhomboid family serine protease
MCIILVNFCVFAYQCYLGIGLFGYEAPSSRDFLQLYGCVPERFFRLHDIREFGTIFISMFLHGGWMHIIGNMWALHLFGDNVEDHLGHVRFLVFYLICGAVAQAAELCVSPGFTGPSIGASGAIAGVIGAYMVLHPNAKIVCFWPSLYAVSTGFIVKIPALWFIIFWFVSQVAGGLLSDPSRGGVAYAAHIGGFCAGLSVYFIQRASLSKKSEPVDGDCVENIIGEVDYEKLDLRPPDCHPSHGWRFERLVLGVETIAVVVSIFASAYFAFNRLTAPSPEVTTVPPPATVRPVSHTQVKPVAKPADKPVPATHHQTKKSHRKSSHHPIKKAP